MKFDSRKILLVALGIFVFLIFFKFFSIMSFPDSQTVLDKGDNFKFYHNQKISQTFTANRDNLSRIEFLLKTPGPNEKDSVRVEVADATCTTPIRQSTLKMTFLNADNLFVAAFPSIADSNGKKYCVTLSYQTSATETRSLRFFTTENTNPDAIFTTIKGEKLKNQSLSMRLVYNNAHWWQDLRELNQRMSQYKPWFLKHFYIATIGILFVILSIVMITALITLKIEEKND